jgi:hypothetical protein
VSAVRLIVSMLAIDRNHETGEVRGVLFSACNTTTGLPGEDLGRIEPPYRGRSALPRIPRQGSGRDRT